MISLWLTLSGLFTVCCFVGLFLKSLKYGCGYVFDNAVLSLSFLGGLVAFGASVYSFYPHSLYLQPKFTTLATFKAQEGNANLDKNTYEASVNGEAYDIDLVQLQTNPDEGTKFVYRKYLYVAKTHEFLSNILGPRTEYRGTLYLPQAEYEHYLREKDK